VDRGPRRLIHEEHARARRNSADERHALLLAAGEDMRVLSRIMAKAHTLERNVGFGLGLAPRERLQAEGDIVEDREMGRDRYLRA
jgi:hypothetical protein